MPRALALRGFRLVADDTVDDAAADAILARLLAIHGDRVQFVMRTGDPGHPPGLPKMFVKGEFLRPLDPLGKRVRMPRALREAEGYAAFTAAGLPVPRLLLHGAQSRARLRGGSLVCTEKIDAENASAALQRRLREDVITSVAAALGATHAAGLVHGDAAIRNFLPREDLRTAWIVDLPRWDRFTPEGALDDLVHAVGSALKSGARREWIPAFFAKWRDAAGAAASKLPADAEPTALAAADDYRAYLIARDRTRADRRRARDASPLRSAPRRASDSERR